MSDNAALNAKSFLTYDVQTARYYWFGPFESRTLPKDAGFEWDTSKKRWYTENFLTAKKLYAYADDCAKISLNNYERRFKESNALHIENIYAGLFIQTLQKENHHLLPYQISGIDTLLKRENVLLADEMGLGKTIQVLASMNCYLWSRALIVCPKGLVLNWKTEAEKWLNRDPIIQALQSGKDHIDHNANVIIVSYSLVINRAIHKQLKTLSFDVAVFDEGHYLKSKDSKRTRTILGKNGKGGLIANCEHRIVLTGTPLLNCPVELWPLYNAFANDDMPCKSYWPFVHRYCDAKKTRFGFDVSGASNLDELKTLLRSTFMVRREKKDVLKDLPGKRLSIIALQPDQTFNVLLAKEKAFDAHAIAKNPNLFQQGSISVLRRKMGDAKVPLALDFIRNQLEAGGKKLVVFAHHRSVMAALVEGLRVYNPVAVTGKTLLSNRKKAVDAFQNDADARVFIGNIQAAGVGITLTAADHVIFVEASWTPADNHQAVDRCHRIGQKNAVLAQFLVIEGSIDAYVISAHCKKQTVIEEVLT